MNLTVTVEGDSPEILQRYFNHLSGAYDFSLTAVEAKSGGEFTEAAPHYPSEIDLELKLVAKLRQPVNPETFYLTPPQYPPIYDVSSVVTVFVGTDFDQFNTDKPGIYYAVKACDDLAALTANVISVVNTNLNQRKIPSGTRAPLFLALSDSYTLAEQDALNERGINFVVIRRGTPMLWGNMLITDRIESIADVSGPNPWLFQFRRN